MRIRIANKKGFTLIEVIVTLILVGITATLAGMWIVNVANGYVFAKMNANTVQNAQLAMTRLTKEFAAIDSIIYASGTSIQYTRKDTNLVTTGPYTVSLQDVDKLQIIAVIENMNIANTLTDRVSGFTLKYCNDVPVIGTQLCGYDWPTTGTRRIIEITLKLTGADNTESEFKKRIAPRNL